MKRQRSIPQVTKMGPCIHTRLSQDTDKIFADQAEKLVIAKSTLLRMYVEEMFKRHGIVELKK